MHALDIKLIRDIRRLWAQALAIALVMAAGVTTLLLGNGAVASLTGTRDAYYRDYRFADVFVSLTRAPEAVGAALAEIDGVLAVDTRITRIALIDMPGMSVPGAVALVSVPADDPAALNRLYLRAGRLPDEQSTTEAAVSEGFAKAHRLRPGASFAVLMNGHRRLVTVTGIAISPEFIYTLGPGDLMPDERRFGVVWMPKRALAAAYDLQGAFSNAVLKLVPGASPDRVIAAVDRLLERYGGNGATPRKDQISHAFLDAELRQLRGMSLILPPIFLLVAAFLVNMTLSRLILLEREQIGLLKALGYPSRAIMLHYVKFVLVIAAIGILIGFVAGTWLGAGMARNYARFFNFPYLVFLRNPAVYAAAALITVGAAVLGASGAVLSVARMPPAVAMAPPAPVLYRRRFAWLPGLAGVVRQSTVMVTRHLLRWPARTLAGILGVGFATAILVGSLWSFGSVEMMIDVTFFRSDRQDATISFTDPKPRSALYDVRNLPGVLAAEPFRSVAVRIANGTVSRKLALTGRPARGDLSRVLDRDLQPMTLPDAGLILSEPLAEILGVTRGDAVDITLLEGDRRRLTLPVSGISVGYLGLGAFAEIDALGRLLGEDGQISGVNILLDPSRLDAFYAAAKAAPGASFVTFLTLTLQKFRATLAENLTVFVSVYAGLAATIAVGVVYNFARISLSEQGRELASLRVLGFTRGEVSGILFVELAIVVLLAQPVGWLLGYGMALLMSLAFNSDLYRTPLVVGREVYAYATIIVSITAMACAAFLRGRINRLDMIEVLKTRE